MPKSKKTKKKTTSNRSRSRRSSSKPVQTVVLSATPWMAEDDLAAWNAEQRIDVEDYNDDGYGYGFSAADYRNFSTDGVDEGEAYSSPADVVFEQQEPVFESVVGPTVSAPPAVVRQATADRPQQAIGPVVSSASIGLQQQPQPAVDLESKRQASLRRQQQVAADLESKRQANLQRQQQAEQEIKRQASLQRQQQQAEQEIKRQASLRRQQQVAADQKIALDMAKQDVIRQDANRIAAEAKQRGIAEQDRIRREIEQKRLEDDAAAIAAKAAAERLQSNIRSERLSQRQRAIAAVAEQDRIRLASQQRLPDSEANRREIAIREEELKRIADVEEGLRRQAELQRIRREDEEKQLESEQRRIQEDIVAAAAKQRQDDYEAKIRQAEEKRRLTVVAANRRRSFYPDAELNPKFLQDRVKFDANQYYNNEGKWIEQQETGLRTQLSTFLKSVATKFESKIADWKEGDRKEFKQPVRITDNANGNIFSTMLSVMRAYASDGYISYNNLLAKISRGAPTVELLQEPLQTFAGVILLRYMTLNNKYDQPLTTWRWSRTEPVSSSAVGKYLDDAGIIERSLQNPADVSKVVARVRAACPTVDRKGICENAIDHDQLDATLKPFFKPGQSVSEWTNAWLQLRIANKGPFARDPFASDYSPLKPFLSTKGNRLAFPNFSSTTLSKLTLLQYANQQQNRRDEAAAFDSKTQKFNVCCAVRIDIPAGFPCIYIFAGFDRDAEQEILLPPCTTVRVDSPVGASNVAVIRPVSVKKVADSDSLIAKMIEVFFYADRQIQPSYEAKLKLDLLAELRREACPVRQLNLNLDV